MTRRPGLPGDDDPRGPEEIKGKRASRSVIIGSGWATAQQPAAGTPAPENRLCTVTFSMGS